jgi:hypothetical protein
VRLPKINAIFLNQSHPMHTFLSFPPLFLRQFQKAPKVSVHHKLKILGSYSPQLCLLISLAFCIENHSWVYAEVFRGYFMTITTYECIPFFDIS